VNIKIEKLILKIREESRRFLSISFGVFLFILFFQPFPLNNLNFDNGLVYIAGFGGIIFITLFIVRILLPWILRENGADEDNNKQFPAYLKGFLIILISTVAFVFYVRYVGFVKITFIITLKVFLICLASTMVLGISEMVDRLTQENHALILEKKIVQKQIEKYEEDYLNKSVEFISENLNENFTLLIAEIAFIRSADNYVEIVYNEGDSFKKKLIRNTLKNVELQIKQYSNFIRCHRICIVNVHFIEKLTRNNENHLLVIKGFNEQLPVSRQYLLKLRETL
jgi:DNA-binding LytR/AlgR family response regulator